MNKISKRYILCFSILLILYNALVWIIPFPKKSLGTFIITYSTSMFAFILQPIIYFITNKNSKEIKSKLYSWPILKVTYIYFLIQLIVSFLFYIIGAFVKIPLWISSVLFILLIGLALIGIIITDTYKNQIEKLEDNEKNNKRFITSLKIETSILAKKYISSPVYKELEEFADAVRYSDPISSESLLNIENEIDNKFNEIKYVLESGNYSVASLKISEIKLLLDQRNQKCKAYK